MVPRLMIDEKEWFKNYGREDRKDQMRRYENGDLDKKRIFKNYLEFRRIEKIRGLMMVVDSKAEYISELRCS